MLFRTIATLPNPLSLTPRASSPGAGEALLSVPIVSTYDLRGCCVRVLHARSRSTATTNTERSASKAATAMVATETSLPPALSALSAATICAVDTFGSGDAVVVGSGESGHVVAAAVSDAVWGHPGAYETLRASEALRQMTGGNEMSCMVADATLRTTLVCRVCAEPGTLVANIVDWFAMDVLGKVVVPVIGSVAVAELDRV